MKAIVKSGLVAVIWALGVSVAGACPFCREAVAGDSVAQGYFWSILLMLLTPLAILAALGTYFYLLVRRNPPSALELPPTEVPQELLVPTRNQTSSDQTPENTEAELACMEK